MQTTVSTLLREFPKVRQAALRGERVIIVTQEGNLVLTAENPPGQQILGGLKGVLHVPPEVDLTSPTTAEDEWTRRADEASVAPGLPLAQADPFDRVIVAMARCRKLPLLTKDRQIVESQLVAVVW